MTRRLVSPHLFLTLFLAVVALPGLAPAQEGESSSASGIDLERMRREVNAMRRLAGEEAAESRALLHASREALTAEHRALMVRRAALTARVAELQNRFQEQEQAIQLLESEAAAQEMDSRTLEGAVRLNAGLLRERATRVPYASLMPAGVDNAVALAMAEDYPDHLQLRQLTETLFAELEHSATVSLRQGTILLPNGESGTAEVLRVGSLLAAAKTPEGRYGYLFPAEGGRALLLAPGDPPSAVSRMLKNAFAGQTGLVPVDFSEGEALRADQNRKSISDHILAGGALVWPIILLGVGAFLYGLARLARLGRVRYGSPKVLETFFSHARAGDYQAAMDLLGDGRLAPAPVYGLLRHMLKNWNGTVTSLEKCRDEAILLGMAPLERGVSFVAIAAAVSPLLGLLGTVTGMISTFDSITLFGNSDPKMLSGGISVALVTTEVGLIAAIPLLLLHYLLSSRVDAIAEDMEQKGAILIARASAQQADAPASCAPGAPPCGS